MLPNGLWLLLHGVLCRMAANGCEGHAWGALLPGGPEDLPFSVYPAVGEPTDLAEAGALAALGVQQFQYCSITENH